jgi:hypothetical protein
MYQVTLIKGDIDNPVEHVRVQRFYEADTFGEAAFKAGQEFHQDGWNLIHMIRAN